MTTGPTEVDRVRSLREGLTATGAGIYLSTHVAGPIPVETMTAVHESDDMELRVGRVGPDREDDLEQREKEARAVAAAVIKASPERLLLAHGAAEAVAAISAEILTQRSNDADAASNAAGPTVLVLATNAAPVVAAVRAVASATSASVELIDAVPEILSSDVAMVVVPHVDRDGTLHDVARVATGAQAVGARLLVDASLSVGAIPVEVGALGADALIADTHRWLLGPDAVAMAWLAPGLGDDVADRLRAATGPFGRGSLLALARSVGWLLMYVELPWVLSRTEQLSQRLYQDLAAIDGVELAADGARHAAIAAFRIRDWEAAQTAEELSRSLFAIVDADTERDRLRVSVGAWTREDELDRFISRVAELAGHTPETLPRKPSLTIISGPTLVPEDA